MSLDFPKPLPKEKQRKGLRRKPARRHATQTPEESQYLDWLHRRPCAAKGMRYVAGGTTKYYANHWCHAGEYEGQEPIQASHLRDMTGMSRKSPDRTCIALCRVAHEMYDQAKGIFAGWTKQARKEWHRRRNIESLVTFGVVSGINLLPKVDE